VCARPCLARASALPARVRVEREWVSSCPPLISFRVGFADAEVIAQEFYPEFTAVDLVSLPNHHIYLRLMVDGTPSAPFSAVTLAP
jgi:hypothetical protein